jgi:hypothetical protein
MIYNENAAHVRRREARTAAFEELLLDEGILRRVEEFGCKAVVFAIYGKTALASVDGVVGSGRTPTAALADALSKMYVPEVQA